MISTAGGLAPDASRLPHEKRVDQSARIPRPNYNKLHALSLPLTIYPLPPLIPHNPLSILHLAFTYVLQLISTPSSHPPVLYQGHFSPETRSVHVVDEVAIRVLWESGFFGKGNLSRSEPSWLDRERRRRGIIVGETSEEVTGRRREERREFKKERARKEREAIEEKLLEEGHRRVNGDVGIVHDVTPSLQNGGARANGSLSPVVKSQILEEALDSQEQDSSKLTTTHASFTGDKSQSKASVQADASISNTNHTLTGNASADIQNQEHLQLTLEEALFLVYGLGVLEIREQTISAIIPISSLLTLCRSLSYFPPLSPRDLQPDDPFLLSYVVYHHFRSLGWVVRPGIKFAVDYLLYLRGPVFSHAQFAIIILPSYEHRYWTSTKELAEATKKKESKSWWWLQCVNRVQTQVRKSLVLVYVEVPPPESKLESVSTPIKNGDGGKEWSAEDDVDIGALLEQYKVRELTVKRWSPNRNKD